MKPRKNRKAAIALALATVPLLVGCGANNSTPPITNVPAPLAPGLGGCIPVSQAIGFTGSNVYLDGSNIVAGAVPGMQTYGTMAIGGAAPTGATFTFARQGVDGSIGFNATNVNTAIPGAPPTVGGNGASINGVLTISSATQQDIIYKFGGMTATNPYSSPYPNTNPYGAPQPMQPQAQVCVSGIAIQSFVTTSGSPRQLYNGSVYLYMNNTQHGYVLYF